MAIRPKIVYPGQVDETDVVNYPDGKPQNDLVEGDGIGTPLEKTWLTDLWGFLQALLLASGISANDSPDTAISSQYLSAVRLISQNSVLFKGVVANGVADDIVKLNDAIAAAAASGLTWLYCPPGVYRLTGRVVMHPNVSLYGVPGRTIFRMDDPSSNLLSFETGTWVGETEVFGITFEGIQANNGAVVFIDPSCAARVRFKKCSANQLALLLQGKLLKNTGSARITFEYCNMTSAKIDASSTFQCHGDVDFVGGTYIMAPAATYTLIEQQNDATSRLRVSGVRFVHIPPNGLGGQAFIDAQGGEAVAVGNEFFIDGTASPAPGFGVILRPDVKWTTDQNKVSGVCSLNKVGSGFGSSALAVGSEIQLTPHSHQTNSNHLLAVTLPDGVRVASVKFSDATPPPFNWPTCLCKGQELDVLLFNATGSFTPQGVSVNGYGLKASQPTFANNQGVSARFVGMQKDGQPYAEWVQVGDWSLVVP